MYLNLYLTFVFLEMRQKLHKRKKGVCIAYRTIIEFIIKTENTISTISTSAIFINKRDLNLSRFRPGYLEVRIVGSCSTCNVLVDENTTVRYSNTVSSNFYR